MRASAVACCCKDTSIIRSTRKIGASLTRPARFVKPAQPLVMAASARAGATGCAGASTCYCARASIAAPAERSKPRDRPLCALMLTLRAIHRSIRLTHATEQLELALATITHIFIERHAIHLESVHTGYALQVQAYCMGCCARISSIFYLPGLKASSEGPERHPQYFLNHARHPVAKSASGRCATPPAGRPVVSWGYSSRSMWLLLWGWRSWWPCTCE